MDDKRIDEIFEYIEDANIDLDSDPIRKGPKYLNNMVAKCRNMTNQIQKYEREVARERLVYERQLNKLEAEYEVRYNDLMSNNSEVVRQPSAKDREAKVNDILKDLRAEITECKALLTDCGHVETVINSKLKELKDVNRDLRLQIRLVEDEIQTGNFWGDQSDQSEKIENEDIDLDDMVPEEQREEDEEEVQPEDYEDLFGDVEDSDEDYDEALDSIESDDSSGEGESEDTDSEDDSVFYGSDDVDFDDLLSGVE